MCKRVYFNSNKMRLYKLRSLQMSRLLYKFTSETIKARLIRSGSLFIFDWPI